MVMLWVVVGLTLAISACCSLFEAVLYSTRVAAVEVAKKRNGSLRVAANRVLKMKKNISEPISAILILNTVANTAGATLAGMYSVKTFGEKWVLLFSIGLTLGILFLSEILPKTLGAVYWRNLWLPTSYPILGLRVILYPAVIFSQSFAKLFMGNHRPRTVTEDELMALTRVGAEEGEISREESQLVHNIILLEDKRAKDILTPRTMIYSLDSAMTVEEYLNSDTRKEVTRIPVYEEHPEKIIGYVHKADVHAVSNPATKTLRDLMRPIEFFPETNNCLHLLIHFLKYRMHIAIICDEYGGVAGLLSLEDLLETMLGAEIVDETERMVDMQKTARRNVIREEKKRGEKT